MRHIDYRPTQYGLHSNGEMVELLKSLEPGGEARQWMTKLYEEVEKEMKVINQQPVSHKAIGEEIVIELVSAMLVQGYWKPKCL